MFSAYLSFCQEKSVFSLTKSRISINLDLHMALPPKFSFFILLPIIIFLSLPSSLLSHSTAPSVYELLPKYALPSGLLPSSVKSYSLSADDGRFIVELQKPCYVQFDDYLIYYEDRVTGRLRYGSITELKGIKVRKFFIWLSVDEIMVDLPPSDSIYFQVGLINKKLEIDQFKAVHSCRDDKGIPCLTSWKDMFQLPPPLQDDLPMLITE